MFLNRGQFMLGIIWDLVNFTQMGNMLVNSRPLQISAENIRQLPFTVILSLILKS